MVSREAERVKILQILKDHRVLNTVEVCRCLNGRDPDDYIYCYNGQGFSNDVRSWDRLCQKPDCIDYRIIHGCLTVLKNRGIVLTTKMRFKDHATWRKGRATDIFRFWYLEKEDFVEMKLKHTLIPYLENYTGYSK